MHVVTVKKITNRFLYLSEAFNFIELKSLGHCQA